MNFPLLQKAGRASSREEMERVLLEGGYAPETALEAARVMWEGRKKRIAQEEKKKSSQEPSF